MWNKTQNKFAAEVQFNISHTIERQLAGVLGQCGNL